MNILTSSDTLILEDAGSSHAVRPAEIDDGPAGASLASHVKRKRLGSETRRKDVSSNCNLLSTTQSSCY